MAINSEPIYAALFEAVKGCYAWQSAQRRLRHPDDLKEVNMPAVFQVQMSDTLAPDVEAMKYGTKGTSKDEILVHLLIFIHTSTGNEWPTSILNPILDTLKTTFGTKEIPKGHVVYNTLGGLVEYAMVSGKIDVHETAKSTSMLAVVPIKILAFS